MRLIDADAIEYESIDSCDTERYERYYGTGIIAVRKEDIDEMPIAHPESHWIPCSERLPEVGREILFCDIDGDIFVGHRAIEHWWSVDDKVKNVTAWMPLLEPYKGATE